MSDSRPVLVLGVTKRRTAALATLRLMCGELLGDVTSTSSLRTRDNGHYRNLRFSRQQHDARYTRPTAAACSTPKNDSCSPDGPYTCSVQLWHRNRPAAPRWALKSARQPVQGTQSHPSLDHSLALCLSPPARRVPAFSVSIRRYPTDVPATLTDSHSDKVLVVVR